jgi:hypothetical protein
VIKGRLERGIQELLVRWIGQVAADASWVDLKAFQQPFPDFKLTVLLVGGEGRCYDKASVQTSGQSAGNYLLHAVNR